MNTILIATAGGLGALIFWGISDWLASKNSKAHSPSQVNLAIQASSALLTVVIWLLMRESLPSGYSILLLSLVGALFTAAYLCFIKALSIGQAGVVVPLSNTYPLLILLLTFLFLTLTFTTLQLAAIAVIVVGAILLSFEKVTQHGLRKQLTREVAYALGAAVFWGVGFFLVGTVVGELSWVVVLGVISVSMTLFAGCIVAMRHRHDLASVFLSTSRNTIGLVAGLALVAGSIAFYMSAELSGSVLVPAVIACASPLMTSVLAAVFDKEKIIPAKRIGAILVVIGVMLLNL